MTVTVLVTILRQPAPGPSPPSRLPAAPGGSWRRTVPARRRRVSADTMYYAGRVARPSRPHGASATDGHGHSGWHAGTRRASPSNCESPDRGRGCLSESRRGRGTRARLAHAAAALAQPARTLAIQSGLLVRVLRGATDPQLERPLAVAVLIPWLYSGSPFIIVRPSPGGESPQSTVETRFSEPASESDRPGANAVVSRVTFVLWPRGASTGMSVLPIGCSFALADRLGPRPHFRPLSRSLRP